MARWRFGWLLAVILVASACANYSVRRVPNKWEREANAGTWGHDDQVAAENMEGLRFYMARAHVVVHKPFPVDSETFVVNGRVSADGKFVAIDSRGSDRSSAAWTKLERYISPGDGSARLPSSMIGAPSRTAPAPSTPAPAPSTPAPAPGASAPPGAHGDPSHANGNAKDDSGSTNGSKEPTGGVSTLELRSDLSVQPTFPMRDFFDITYLPDYAEQYVIEGDARAGMLEMKMVWGPGNTLISLDARLDNSAIISPLLDVYQGLVKQGGEFLRKSLIPGAQGAGDTLGDLAQTRDLAGADVSVAIHVVRFAAPGVYPILKPQEYPALANARGAASNDRVIVGHPPATTVSYKVYEVLIAECLSATRPTAIEIINEAIEREPRTAPASSADAQGRGSDGRGNSSDRVSASSDQRRAMQGDLAGSGQHGLTVNDATFDRSSGVLTVTLIRDDPSQPLDGQNTQIQSLLAESFRRNVGLDAQIKSVTINSAN